MSFFGTIVGTVVGAIAHSCWADGRLEGSFGFLGEGLENAWKRSCTKRA
ncbi:MAG: hypothetical protein RBJ76_26895 [Stenomitos frigidus ULC029]